MKALSIQQPYAFAIVHGWKPVENRSWPTRYRGPFLVHTGKKEMKDDVDDVIAQIAQHLSRDADEVREFYRRHARTGGYCGAAVVTDCVTHHDSDWFYGPYGFVLADATPFTGWHFIEGNGQRGWFDVPADATHDLDVWLSSWKHSRALGVKGSGPL